MSQWVVAGFWENENGREWWQRWYIRGWGECKRERDKGRAQEAWNGSSTMQWMIFMSSFNSRTVKIQHTTQYNWRDENGKGVSFVWAWGGGEKLLQSCNHRQSKQNYRKKGILQNKKKERVKQREDEECKKSGYLHVWNERVCLGVWKIRKG